MKAKKTYFPLAPVENLMRDSANCKISDEATKRLTNFLEEITTEIAKKAGELTRFENKKVLKVKELEYAIKLYFENRNKY